MENVEQSVQIIAVTIVVLDSIKIKILTTKPLAKHVSVVITALLGQQVVHILQPLVLLEPMHRVVRQRVIPVPVVSTALLVRPVVGTLQPLVLLEPTPQME